MICLSPVINHPLTIYALVLEALYKVVNVLKWTVYLYDDIAARNKPSVGMFVINAKKKGGAGLNKTSSTTVVLPNETRCPHLSSPKTTQIKKKKNIYF